MSRIGKLPVPLPSGVTVSTLKDGTITVNGPKGELQQQLDPAIKLEIGDDEIVVSRPTNRPEHRALHGLVRSLLANMIEGVTNGFEKQLEITGVGFRFIQKGSDVDLSAGFSHPVVLTPPDGIELKVHNQNEMSVIGIDKQMVGQVAAQIRMKRPPEPYKGKGIKYKGEYVRRKIGKRAQ